MPALKDASRKSNSRTNGTPHGAPTGGLKAPVKHRQWRGMQRPRRVGAASRREGWSRLVAAGQWKRWAVDEGSKLPLTASSRDRDQMLPSASSPSACQPCARADLRGVSCSRDHTRRPGRPHGSGAGTHMRLSVVGLLVFVAAGCSAPQIHNSAPLSACTVEPASRLLVATKVEGARLALPKDAEGPSYDPDDWHRSWPMWHGAHWYAHMVYGNDGLTQFMSGARCCAINDREMHRNVCVGKYIRYGAMADISRIASPDKISSIQVSIEPNGVSEADALVIIASTVTTWEQP